MKIDHKILTKSTLFHNVSGYKENLNTEVHLVILTTSPVNVTEKELRKTLPGLYRNRTVQKDNRTA